MGHPQRAVALCVGSLPRCMLPMPAHHLQQEVGKLQTEGLSSTGQVGDGATTQQRSPSQPESLLGAT